MGFRKNGAPDIIESDEGSNGDTEIGGTVAEAESGPG